MTRIRLEDLEYKPSEPICGCRDPHCGLRELDEGQARHVVGAILDGAVTDLANINGKALIRWLEAFGLELTVS